MKDDIMRLRTKILLSYVILIGLITCGVYFVLDFLAINSLTCEHLAAAREGVSNIARLNSIRTQQTVNNLGKWILSLTAERDAALAAGYLKTKGPDYWKDYDALRRDPEFRKIVAHDITVYNQPGAGYTDCFDRNCLAVVHPLSSVEGKNYREWAKEYPEMWQLVSDSVRMGSNAGLYRFINAAGKPEDKFMVIKHIPDTDLLLTASVFLDRFYTPVREGIMEDESKMAAAVNKRIQSASIASSQKVKLWSLPFIGGAFLLCCLFGIWFSGSITIHLRALIRAVETLGQGNFSVKIPETGAYETVQLAKTFNMLGNKLEEYTSSLQLAAAAREAVESEIKIARSIQESLLPKKFPAGEWFAIGAALQPAREVAGDFYDCFERGGKLYMIIGDVSGKGVPAAFFMGVVRTMLRDIIHNENDPGRILTIANRHLSLENETCMFVTLFLAVYDLQTGEMEYANGGHNEFLSVMENQPAGTFGFTGDMALGIIPDTEFKTRRHAVRIGETMIFYTDGVTEAVSPAQVLYGIERLQDVVTANAALPVQEVCDKIVADAMEYEQGARFDDITVMVFRRNS